MLKSIVLISSFAIVHLNYCYVASAYQWKFDLEPNNTKQVVVFGDCHSENPIDPEHNGCLQGYCDILTEENSPKLMIIESRKFTYSKIFQRLLKWHCIRLKASQENTLLNIRILAYNNGSLGPLRFKISDCRGPVFCSCLELLFYCISKKEYALHHLIPEINSMPQNRTAATIDEYLNKHPESWKNFEIYKNELKRLSVSPWYLRPHWHKFSTIGELISEISNTISLIKKEVAKYPNIKTMQRVLRSIETSFQALRERFENVSHKSTFLDWIINEINNKKSFSFIDEFGACYLLPLITELADIGFMVKILKNLPKYQTIILYVGGYHATSINEFLVEYAEHFNGSCLQSYPLVMDDNLKAKPISTDTLIDFCVACCE